jgi:hypothetical protein
MRYYLERGLLLETEVLRGLENKEQLQHRKS